MHFTLDDVGMTINFDCNARIHAASLALAYSWAHGSVLRSRHSAVTWYGVRTMRVGLLVRYCVIIFVVTMSREAILTSQSSIEILYPAAVSSRSNTAACAARPVGRLGLLDMMPISPFKCLRITSRVSIQKERGLPDMMPITLFTRTMLFL